MGDSDLGTWAPLPLPAVVALFDGAPFRWWIAGGHALELHCGRSWRDHGDTDVGICRRDAHQLAVVLDGWQVAVAAAGELRRWHGEPLALERDENNLWCRSQADGPWELDVIVGEGDDERWVYRRDSAITLPWRDAVLTSQAGVSYLAPEIQLLFKAKGLRPKDHLDAREVIPSLAAERRERLARLLVVEHPWQAMLGDGT